MIALIVLFIGGGGTGGQSEENKLDYEENLETRLKNIIGELCCCEDVRIMITTENENGTGYSNKNAAPKIKGAAIICKKPAGDEIEKEIISLVSKTLGIGSNHIFVGSSHIMK